MESRLIDGRACRILLAAYWSGRGWRVPRGEPSAEDFAYAKSMGVMFDHETLTHDGALERVMAAKGIADLESVASAFVASLTSRAVHLRPPLASYYAVRNAGGHRLTGSPACSLCGQFARWEHDFSATNFARLKWGSVPRLFLVDHAFILERFANEPRATTSDADHLLMHRLLTAADSMAADARARDLERAWRPLIRSSREERDAMIEILTACGVLTPSRKTLDDVRRIPLKTNWTDEAALWRGDDGVNHSQASRLFGWT